jgi:hypothetical protein
MGATSPNGVLDGLPCLDLSYDHKNSEQSAKELVYRIQSKWRDHPEQIHIHQFKEGITNTVGNLPADVHVLLIDRVSAL